MKRGRPRQINPHIPAHIPQDQIPVGVYFDHRRGSWHLRQRVGGVLTRSELANNSATLADLHRLAEEHRAGDPRGTLDWLAGLFEASDAFAALSPATQEDYRYCRAILRQRQDKKGAPLSTWPVDAFTSPVIQRLVDAIGKDHPAKANHLLRWLRRLFRWGGNRAYCAKTNPADKIEPAREKKRRPIPPLPVMRAVIEHARACGAIATRRKGSCPSYLWAVAELAYACRLRGIEVVTLTDAHHLPKGIHTNRRKGSRDNIVEWSPTTREAWGALITRRDAIWKARGIATPIHPSQRPLVVQEDGTPLPRRALGTAWKRLMASAVAGGLIEPDQVFGLHALKRRGITDTPGTRADKQQASGHKEAAMLDVYDFEVPRVKPAGAAHAGAIEALPEGASFSAPFSAAANKKGLHRCKPLKDMAPEVGLEPTTP